MNVEELIDKYFEGETTCEEEKQLRHFFTQGIVPEHLQVYRPLFGFLEIENHLYHGSPTPDLTTHTMTVTKDRSMRRRVLYILSGVAAGLILLLGIAGIHRHWGNSPDTYVIIDGKQYSDPELARQQALAAFQNVSLSEDEVFSSLFEE